jgi:hypothetical protein
MKFEMSTLDMWIYAIWFVFLIKKNIQYIEAFEWHISGQYRRLGKEISLPRDQVRFEVFCEEQLFHFDIVFVLISIYPHIQGRLSDFEKIKNGKIHYEIWDVDPGYVDIRFF